MGVHLDNLERSIRRLPPELRQEVADFVGYLLEKRLPKTSGAGRPLKLDWRGTLSDLKEEYDAVSLQHQALDWR